VAIGARIPEDVLPEVPMSKTARYVARLRPYVTPSGAEFLFYTYEETR
jgi:hypothetical protein